jgi:flagellar hook assembly protein FlgD
MITTTNISYSIQNDNLITIKIYDILGKEVKVLVNEFKPAGSYKISFDGSNLSNGIYFYRMEAGDFIQVRR